VAEYMVEAQFARTAKEVMDQHKAMAKEAGAK
jgi:hypothetical protein